MTNKTEARLKKERQAEIADELDQAIEAVFVGTPDIDVKEQSALLLNIAIKNIMFETNALVATEVVMGCMQSWIAFARHMAGFKDPEIEAGEEGDYDFVREDRYEAILYTRHDEDEEVDPRLLSLDEYEEEPN